MTNVELLNKLKIKNLVNNICEINARISDWYLLKKDGCVSNRVCKSVVLRMNETLKERKYTLNIVLKRIELESK